MIIYVPKDFPSIQEAVDASKTGDHIQVTQGKYSENVVINVQDLTIEALLGVEMDGEFALENAFTITSDNVTIKGFRIFHYRDGIFFLSNEVRIINCYLSFNTRYGIYFSGDYNIIEDCSINFSTISGINFTGKKNTIKNTTLDDNSAAGVAMVFPCNNNKIINNLISGSTVCISNVAAGSGENLFSNNLLQRSQFGVSIYNDNNEISNNHLSGIPNVGFLIAGSSNRITNSNIGIIDLSQSTTIRDTTFVDNEHNLITAD